MNFNAGELDLIEHCVSVALDQWTEEADEFEHQIKVADNVLRILHGVPRQDISHSCPDCGQPGEYRGHMECQYPTDDQNIEPLEDPMMSER